ncbi:MAG: hypothetical protein QOE31_3369 [Solirubrobacteraceae bacterium]|nr:hypothetical protein [Solirubrobacteraceae bacterium]
MATVPGKHPAGGDGSAGIARLTPAEMHALSRSAPLTPVQFKAQREVAERRNVPLRVLLDTAERSAPRRSDQRA